MKVSKHDFVIGLMVSILVFMIIGNSLSVYIEGKHSDIQHQRSLDDRSAIKQEQAISKMERHENRQMILNLKKQLEELKKHEN